MKLALNLDDFMRALCVDYVICGGYAIDGFIGHLTRKHKDLDVAVFSEDRNKIVSYMLGHGWDVYEPCGCEYLHKITDVNKQKAIKTNIWCVKPTNKHYNFVEHKKDMYAVSQDDCEQTELDFIEFLFNKREGSSFIYSRNNKISRDMEKAVLNINGIPYLAPEIALLYKSTSLQNSDYQHDFDITLSLLSDESKIWLKDALNKEYPNGHEWLGRL